LAVGAVIIPRSKDPNGGRIDLLGAVLSTAGVASLVYGLIEAPTHGWLSGETLAFLAAGLTALGLFVAWQRRTAEPMLDVRLFRKPAFGVSSLTLTMVFFALMGIFFSISQLFQLVMGYGTFESALRSSPIFVAMILVAPQAPTIAKRIGTRRTVAGGLVLVAAGIGILSQLADVPSYAQVGAGMGSAMNDTTRELGGSLGIAVLGSVMASNYAAHVAKAVVGMPAQAAAAVKSSLAGGLTVAAQTGNGTLAATAKSAFMSGLTLSMVVGAVIILAAAALAFFGLPADEPAFVEPAL